MSGGRASGPKPKYEPRHDLVGDPEVAYMETVRRVSREDMDETMRIVRRMPFVQEFGRKLVSVRGAKRRNCNFEGLVAAMVLNVVLLGLPPHLSTAAETLYERMPMRWRRQFPSDRYTRPTPKRRKAATKATERLWKKFRLLLDSEPIPYNRRLTEEEMKRVVALFPSPEDAAKMDAALHWICNRILAAVVEVGLDKVTPGWRTAETLYGMDATSFLANARPYTKEKCSFDPQAGWYKRDLDHPPDPPLTTASGAPRRRRRAKERTKEALEWAYETHIMRLTVNPYSDYRDQLELPVGFWIDRPAVAPDRIGLAAVDGALATGLPPGTIAFDSAYIKQPFLEGCMERGFGVLFDPFSTLADKHPEYLGARIVGGRPCCPGVDNELLQINNDYHSEKSDAQTMYDRAATLEPFRPWQKDKTADGRLRFVCPAKAPNGRGATCNCPLVRDSYDTTDVPEVPFPPGVKRKTSDDDPLRRDRTAPGLLCTADSILIDPSDLVMSWQAEAHRGPEWRALFAAGRNATERGHSHVKAGYGEALNVADRRGLRGKANARLLVSFLLAAQAFRLIRSWLRNAERNDDGVIIAPPLKHRRGKGRRPWHSRPMPPLPERTGSRPDPEPEPPPDPPAATESFS